MEQYLHMVKLQVAKHTQWRYAVVNLSFAGYTVIH